ncbi:MAG: hypothetical protein DDT38_01254 [Firmicutes bacterium]|nr:hypothetical protein [candidate division NPL-UPA2 bacterium]
MGLSYGLDLPCTLNEALQTLSKAQLIELRDLAELKISSGLRKQDMLAKLEAELPGNINKVFNLFDESRASLIRLVLSHRGALPLREIDLADDDLQCLTGQGVFVVGENNAQPCLGVPVELLDRFQQFDGLPYAERVATNTRWVVALQGMIYHYGVIQMFHAFDYLSLLFGVEERYNMRPSFWEVLPTMQEFRGLYRVADRYFCDASIDTATQILDRRPAELGYKLFNLEELYAAADPLYIDPTVESDLLEDYLLEHYDLTEDNAKRLMHVGRRFALREGDVGAALAVYAVVCNGGSSELAPELVRLVVDYLENTPHWALCGHSMVDLAAHLPAREEASGELVDFSEYKNRSK